MYNFDPHNVLLQIYLRLVVCSRDTNIISLWLESENITRCCCCEWSDSVSLALLQEQVGNFLADFYMVNGLVLESRKRREHLSEEDILRNKAIMESFSKGGGVIEQSFEVSYGWGDDNTPQRVLNDSHYDVTLLTFSLS